MKEAINAIAKSASGAISSTAGLLYGVILQSGTEDSLVSIRDGGSGGTIKLSLSLNNTTAAGDTNQTIMFKYPVIFTTDIYAELSGALAQTYAFYKSL